MYGWKELQPLARGQASFRSAILWLAGDMNGYHSQEESLRSKPKVLANIEELERLQPLLREARNEDEAAIKAAARAQALSEAQAAAEEASASRIAELEAVGNPPLLFIHKSSPQHAFSRKHLLFCVLQSEAWRSASGSIGSCEAIHSKSHEGVLTEQSLCAAGKAGSRGAGGISARGGGGGALGGRAPAELRAEHAGRRGRCAPPG